MDTDMVAAELLYSCEGEVRCRAEVPARSVARSIPRKKSRPKPADRCVVPQGRGRLLVGTLGGVTAAQGTQGTQGTQSRLLGPATGPRGEGALVEVVRGGGGCPFTDDAAAVDEGAVTRAHAARRREASEGSRAMALTGGGSGAAGEARADAVAEVVAEVVAEAVAKAVAEPVAEPVAEVPPTRRGH